MGMYSSFKLIALIDKPYREWFDKLLKSESIESADSIDAPRLLNKESRRDSIESKMYKYINYLYCGEGGFFNVDKEYSKDTGILVCGRRLKNYGHISDCEGGEIEFCINNGVLPFGQVIEYYEHDDDMCYDCTCNPQKLPSDILFFEKNQSFYLNKYKSFIENFENVSSPIETKMVLKDKMKEFMIKDIESILDRYSKYNFDLTELKKSLKSL